MRDSSLALRNTELIQFAVEALPRDFEQGDALRLDIALVASNISVADFSVYLKLIDRIYGRIRSEGLSSYSKHYEQRLQVTELRRGSLIVSIQQVLETLRDSTALYAAFLFLLALKYAPSALKAVAESVESVTNSAKNLEERKLIRAQRRKLEGDLRRVQLIGLPREQLEKAIPHVIDAIFELEEARIPAATRLNQKSVKQVELHVKKKRRKTTAGSSPPHSSPPGNRVD